MWRGRKKITLKQCQKSNFHKCEMFTSGYFLSDSHRIPGLKSRKERKCGIYHCANTHVYMSFTTVVALDVDVLFESCLRKREGWIFNVLLTGVVFEQGWLWLVFSNGGCILSWMYTFDWICSSCIISCCYFAFIGIFTIPSSLKTCTDLCQLQHIGTCQCSYPKYRLNLYHHPIT